MILNHTIACALRSNLWLLFCLLIAFPAPAQIGQDAFADIIEQVIQDLELDGDFDYDATYERLYDYLDHPADLNTADLEDFVSMGLLTDGHLFALRSHIQAVGPLISIYELQSVPGFDLE
jgi:hypothetical protein